MTTKRKQILKAVAAAGSATMDDLMLATGLERKNLHDNLKATMKEFLIERIRDDVTGLPAYKTTAKGRMWLDRNENSSVTTQAGSGDITPAVAHCSTSLASVLPGKGATVIEPPKPDESPVAVRSDESALSKTLIEFCVWLGRRVKNRAPLNLREAKAMIEEALSGSCRNADLLAMEKDHQSTEKKMQAIIDSLRSDLDTANRINNDMAEQLLTPIDPKPIHYIVTDTYLMAGGESEATEIAFELAKQTDSAAPVIVFSSHKARELRINWRDA